MTQHPKLSPRPEITVTPPAYHGAFDYAELARLELVPDEVLDFSVNSNPYGPSDRVQQAIYSTPLDRYPDREALALRQALAEQLAVAPAQLVVGNGGAELLWLVSFTFLERGDRALVIGPTFGEYRRLAALMGAQVEHWTAQPAADFAIQPEVVAQQLARLQPKMVFLCNPNNPTGSYAPPEVVAGWAQAHPQTLFVVDEAYLAFAAGARSMLTLGLANLVVLRSMTKDYALAGLRLGYLVGHNPAIIAAIAQTRPAWNVNSLAQAAGLAALADQAYVERCLVDLAQASQSLVTGLQSLGLAPVPSTTHFFLLPVADGAAFRRRLLRQGLLVRDCASFGLPAYVRLASRRPEDNRRLLAAITELVEGK